MFPLVRVACLLLWLSSSQVFVAEPPVESAPQAPAPVLGWVEKRTAAPAGSEIYDAQGRRIASFTDGCRTALLDGKERGFSERTAAHKVVSSQYVRVLPKPFDGKVDRAWLSAALADTAPDVLAISMQYVEGAPDVNKEALRIAGDADYGPLKNDARQEGADFNDYLGITWTNDKEQDKPEKSQARCVDCSGFMRLVWGYRCGLSLTLKPGQDATLLPRRAVDMARAAPGVLIIKNEGARPADFGLLRPGDLVFFDASKDDGTDIDHVGMYLGLDEAKHPRFISSRKSINGPTFGDFKGDSRLDGEGLYAKAFRCARRL
jgi:cell wall-associated NlpC family hydrolase